MAELLIFGALPLMYGISGIAGIIGGSGILVYKKIKNKILKKRIKSIENKINDINNTINKNEEIFNNEIKLYITSKVKEKYITKNICEFIGDININEQEQILLNKKNIFKHKFKLHNKTILYNTIII
jgi:hypothetical protein